MAYSGMQVVDATRQKGTRTCGLGTSDMDIITTWLINAFGRVLVIELRRGTREVLRTDQ